MCANGSNEHDYCMEYTIRGVVTRICSRCSKPENPAPVVVSLAKDLEQQWHEQQLYQSFHHQWEMWSGMQQYNYFTQAPVPEVPAVPPPSWHSYQSSPLPISAISDIQPRKQPPSLAELSAAAFSESTVQAEIPQAAPPPPVKARPPQVKARPPRRPPSGQNYQTCPLPISAMQ